MSKMRIAVMLPGGHLLPENRRLMKQLGCTDVIGPGHRPQPESKVWEYADIMQDKRQVERDGLRFEVFEGSPRADKIFWNLPGKEEQLENFCKSLKNLGAAGIRVIQAMPAPLVPNMS